MKCVKNTDGGKIVRVQEALAKKLVEQGWSYCSKTEWKKKVRDIKK